MFSGKSSRAYFRHNAAVGVEFQLEQFHFEIALLTRKRQPPTSAWIPEKRPKAARRAVPISPKGVRASTATLSAFSPE